MWSLAASRDALGPPRLVLPLAGLATLVGVLAVQSPALAVVAVAGLAFVVLALRSLVGGLCVFTVLIFFEQVPGVGEGGLSPTKVVGAVLVISWLLVLARDGRFAPVLLRDRPLFAGAAIFLVAWALASRLWASDTAVASSNGVRLGLGVILVFIVFSAVRDERGFRWLVWAYLVGAFFSALVGFAQTSPEAGAVSAEEGRLAGGIADPNELASILVPALALSCFALAAVKGSLLRFALLVSVGMSATALFFTESRGGLVALATAMVAAVLLAGPLRPRMLAISLFVAALGISYYALIAPPESLQRLTEFAVSGGTGRTDLWSIAMAIIGDNPIVGVGAGNFQVVEPTYAVNTINLPNVTFIVDTPKVAHNTYLELFAELGFVGVGAFGALVVGAFVWAGRAVRAFAQSGDLTMELLGRGLIVGLIGMLSAYTFISGQYEKQLWLLLGLGVGLYSVARPRGRPGVRDPAAR